uniref:Putative small subunit ribosomal protein S27Ae n=1 Tax=Schistosoma japonicum TaxID=6182 RepID=Q5D8K9_SCHJA|nr:SJCHGC02785 protein [Schistosoma japonicum]CAX72385.1 putative small subunit ribosomal protein S27Ae [Schistosoma japonicum]CAX72388.1 putative small subunit ribosomal protein S27Ae [Schistosoma japonicum]CAX79446.1 putative small subunit ribosomal protein S27Ae [Schistosoma japonicum]CAX79447.1 putative small subunit ribosomal protein S27Ae [Schistosoma japonicum]
MRLLVRSHLGGSIVVSAGPNESVKSLKDKISVATGIHASTQSLYHHGLPLLDSSLLEELDFTDLDNVDVNCELLGGGKKRKKKNYTTPRKIKHKKKKVKLATLKFYKVDSNGKITRLRRECPSEKCGAGVFMASHFDREYCGKCALTYKHVNK